MTRMRDEPGDEPAAFAWTCMSTREKDSQKTVHTCFLCDVRQTADHDWVPECSVMLSLPLRVEIE